MMAWPRVELGVAGTSRGNGLRGQGPYHGCCATPGSPWLSFPRDLVFNWEGASENERLFGENMDGHVGVKITIFPSDLLWNLAASA